MKKNFFLLSLKMKAFFVFTTSLLLWSYALLAQANVPDVVLPLPEIPIEKTGVYRAPLEKMVKQLKDNELIEFYADVCEFLDKIKKERYDDSRNWAKTAEESAAIEWACQFVVLAPFISWDFMLSKFNALPYAKKKESKFQRTTQKEAKTKVFHWLCYPSEPTKRNLKSYRYHHFLTQDPEIFPKRTPDYERRRMTYLAVLYRSIHDSKMQNLIATGIKAEPKYQSPPLPELDYTPPKYPDINFKTATKEEKERYDKNMKVYYAELEKNKSPQNLRRDAWDHWRTEVCFGKDDKLQPLLIRNLVWTFPKDGATVQNYLRMAGYTDDAALAAAISTLYPKTSVTAYLYKGLSLPASSASGESNSPKASSLPNHQTDGAARK